MLCSQTVTASLHAQHVMHEIKRLMSQMDWLGFNSGMLSPRNANLIYCPTSRLPDHDMESIIYGTGVAVVIDHITFYCHEGFTLQVSLFLQEGIQVDGARVVLPQPVSIEPTPPVGTLTTYQSDGTLKVPDVNLS